MFEKLYGILQQRAYIPTLLFFVVKKKNRPVVQDFGNTAFDCSGKGTKAGVPLRSLGQIRVSDGGERSGRLPVHEADKIFPEW